MKALWRIGVLVLGIALFGFAVERIGSGRVRGELEAMSSAIIVIFALSLIRLHLQTQSWSFALKHNGIQSSRIELMFLRLASQGIGYLTVLGPAAGGFALALARRLRDMMFSLAGLVWLASRTHTGEDAPILRGAIECKL
jgi:hypothetical protein